MSCAATFNMTLNNVARFIPQTAHGNHLVHKILKQNNYTIIKVSPPWYEQGCYGHEDVCINRIGMYTDLWYQLFKNGFQNLIGFNPI